MAQAMRPTNNEQQIILALRALNNGEKITITKNGKDTFFVRIEKGFNLTPVTTTIIETIAVETTN